MSSLVSGKGILIAPSCLTLVAIGDNNELLSHSPVYPKSSWKSNDDTGSPPIVAGDIVPVDGAIDKVMWIPFGVNLE